MPSEHFDIVAAHVINTLPLDIEQRVTVLTALIEVMPPNNPRYDDIKELLSYLRHHEILVLEIPNKLTPQ